MNADTPAALRSASALECSKLETTSRGQYSPIFSRMCRTFIRQSGPRSSLSTITAKKSSPSSRAAFNCETASAPLVEQDTLSPSSFSKEAAPAQTSRPESTISTRRSSRTVSSTSPSMDSSSETVTMNRLPAPCSLWKCMVPFIIWTIFSAIAKPRPVPWIELARGSSARKKGTKIRCGKSSEMPRSTP